jgi:hypothetical protein
MPFVSCPDSLFKTKGLYSKDGGLLSAYSVCSSHGVPGCVINLSLPFTMLLCLVLGVDGWTWHVEAREFEPGGSETVFIPPFLGLPKATVPHFAGIP